MTPPSPLDEPFLTDRLCYIIAEQNEIIKEQANTIAQLDAINPMAERIREVDVLNREMCKDLLIKEETDNGENLRH